MRARQKKCDKSNYLVPLRLVKRFFFIILWQHNFYYGSRVSKRQRGHCQPLVAAPLCELAANVAQKVCEMLR